MKQKPTLKSDFAVINADFDYFLDKEWYYYEANPTEDSSVIIQPTEDEYIAGIMWDNGLHFEIVLNHKSNKFKISPHCEYFQEDNEIVEELLESLRDEAKQYELEGYDYDLNNFVPFIENLWSITAPVEALESVSE